MTGRFAPSPTGAMHAGSLIAAVAARCAAIHSGGNFLVRIDDLDTGRIVPNAATGILRTLRRFGLMDEDTVVLHQSDRIERYHDALRQLAHQGLLYACSCSRRMLAGSLSCIGDCVSGQLTSDALDLRLRSGTQEGRAIRVRLHGRLAFDDVFQGHRVVDLSRDVGDMVVHRRDGIVAWSLATACDDAELDQVVRGADLHEPTAAQIALMDRLDLVPPRYAHVPVLLDEQGEKLGKSTGAYAIDDADPLALLHATWRFLGQTPLQASDVLEFHRTACDRFDETRVPRVASQHDATLAGRVIR